ncbi:MAG: hypothetical protein WD602_05725 [Actinomycetota bacterium]
MKGFITGAAVGALIGYTQGAKDGRQRYAQIKQSTQRLASTPVGQKLAESASTAKTRTTGQAEEVLTVVMNRAAGINAEGEKV